MTETSEQRRERLIKERNSLKSRAINLTDRKRLTVVEAALAEYGTVPVAQPKGDRVDAWMRQPLLFLASGKNIQRQKLFLVLIGMWAIVPFIFMAVPLFTGNSDVLNNEVADVLGTSSALLLFLTLLITPLVTITGQRWFVPLRQWFGIMFAFSALLDATTASLVTGPSFAHGPLGRLLGHSFLLVGAFMVSLAIPLLLTANRHSQRMMGRYWKILQRFTYAIWALLTVHMALLFGFGPKEPGDIFFKQRFFQILSLGIILFFWRIPSIKRWAVDARRNGQGWKVYAVFIPMALLAIGFLVFMFNEEIQKGVTAFGLQVIND